MENIMDKENFLEKDYGAKKIFIPAAIAIFAFFAVSIVAFYTHFKYENKQYIDTIENFQFFDIYLLGLNFMICFISGVFFFIHLNKREKVLFKTNQALEFEIQQRKKNQNILQENNEKFEELVSERSKQLIESNKSLEREILDRKMAEEAFKRAYTELHQVFNHASYGMCIIDKDFKISKVNDTFLHLFRVSRTRCIGQKYCDILKHTDCGETSCRLKDIFNGQPYIEYEIERSFDDGTKIFCVVSVVPYRDINGDISGVVESFKDVTAHKKSEESRKKLEEQLLQSQKMESIGTLAGGIAHDFNNILSIMFGYIDFLSKEVKNNQTAAGYLKQITEAAEHAKDIVKQILIFSRRTKHEVSPIDIYSIVRDALKLIFSGMPPNIEIKQSLDPSAGIISADANEIRQVLINLCTNAFYAMKEKGGILSINLESVEIDEAFSRVHSRLAQGHYIRLTVSDTGIGIEPATLKRVFEPFFTTKGVGEGTGLGLSVVQGIVLSLGGEITVYSEPGKGTTFHVYLPRIFDKIKDTTDTNENPIRGNERIMIVDDEEKIAHMMKQMLENLGYSVYTHTKGEDALEAFRNSPGEFDVIITDQSMPQMTGVKVAKEITSIRSDIPIILLTGYSDVVSSDNYKKFGINDYLMKPVTARELTRAIKKVVTDINAQDKKD
ncbi:two component system sensor histidine kinase, hybrid [Candidatus Omnitrophus magneticus]|uniref:histidine kinase n=1 Tax=Candidatus Omnitrophus magneticus TaxID=1609969 RepID=A0A0F0CWN5_9BACT|nr:two component system sensor histidine kinase, hybrid [Candidatus Omnitrophus magneticus]